MTGYLDYVYGNPPKSAAGLNIKAPGTCRPAGGETARVDSDEFIDYTDFFLDQDLRWRVTAGEGASHNECHQAKGLEFPHVFF